MSRWRSAVGGLVLCVAVAICIYAAPPANANHGPAGSGGCTTHDTTCYPQCRWEWTGTQASLGQTADNGPCPLAPEYTTKVAEETPVSAVAVNNLPSVQAVSGSVNVSGTVNAVQPAGETYDVGGASFSCSDTEGDCAMSLVPDNTTRQALGAGLLLVTAYFVFRVGRS